MADTNAHAGADSHRPPLPTRPQRHAVPPSLTDEQRSELEKKLDLLTEELSEIQELHSAIEQVIADRKENDDSFKEQFVSYFNQFTKKSDALLEKLGKEVEYTRSLELQIENNELKREVLISKKAWEEEKAQIRTALFEIKSQVTEHLAVISARTEELNSADTLIEDSIARFRDDATNASSHEYDILKNQCMKELVTFRDECQKNLQVLKTHCLDFLSQCEAENKALIKKVPGTKVSTIAAKDIILYGILTVNVIVLVAQRFL